jgi:hypothetical protein
LFVIISFLCHFRSGERLARCDVEPNERWHTLEIPSRIGGKTDRRLRFFKISGVFSLSLQSFCLHLPLYAYRSEEQYCSIFPTLLQYYIVVFLFTLWIIILYLSFDVLYLFTLIYLHLKGPICFFFTLSLFFFFFQFHFLPIVSACPATWARICRTPATHI